MSLDNVVLLCGRTTKDAEMRTTPQGTAIAIATIAVNDPKRETEYFRVTLFGKTAVNFKNHCRKGREVTVVGHLKTSSYEKNGNRIFAMEIIADRFKLHGAGQIKNAEESEEINDIFEEF